MYAIGDGADIWVLPLGRQTPTRVTFESADDIQPAWMPDGRLVFTSTRDGGNALFVAAVRWHRQGREDCGRPWRREVSGPLAGPGAVTPDGKFVVARNGEDIVMLSVEDKTVTPLIEGPFRERNPEVSRDGRWIAYQSDESGERRSVRAAVS